MKEQEEFKVELESLGIQLVNLEDIEGCFGLGIEVDLDTDVDYSHLVKEKLVMKKLTKRKDFFYIMLKSYDTEKKRLTLMVASPIDKNVFDFFEKTNDVIIGTNFPDLCWYYAEGTTELTKEEVETKFREDALMGDLNWFLPTRIIDNFIEIMHTLNQSFLQGLMQDTICYGPYLMSDK